MIQLCVSVTYFVRSLISATALCLGSLYSNKNMGGYNSDSYYNVWA